MECFGVLNDSAITVKGIYIHLSVCFRWVRRIIRDIIKGILPNGTMAVIGSKAGYIIFIPLMSKCGFYTQRIYLSVGEAVEAGVIFIVKMSAVQTAFLVCFIIDIISGSS